MTMPLHFRFTVDGPAVPQPRPRVGQFGAYYPKRVKKQDYEGYKEQVQAAALQERPVENWPDAEGRWLLTVHAYLPGKMLGDADKILATVMDALEGIVWVNDRQVDEVFVTKRYQAAKPRIYVAVEVLSRPRRIR